MNIHKNYGPGMQPVHSDSGEPWYGPGYCGVCGSREVVPQAVRWWDPDDGWRMGVLCVYCGEDVAVGGPWEGDYALYALREDPETQAERIDVSCEMGDLDGAYSETNP